MCRRGWGWRERSTSRWASLTIHSSSLRHQSNHAIQSNFVPARDAQRFAAFHFTRDKCQRDVNKVWSHCCSKSGLKSLWNCVTSCMLFCYKFLTLLRVRAIGVGARHCHWRYLSMYQYEYDSGSFIRRVTGGKSVESSQHIQHARWASELFCKVVQDKLFLGSVCWWCRTSGCW